HMINVCVQTLRGIPSAEYPLSKRNALRLLVHFLGDLHQPLHVGVGFIDETNPHRIVIATNPVTIARQKFPGDRGGNQLIIDNDRANLHGHWDFDLVKVLMNVTHRSTSDALASLLRSSVRPQPNWNPGGPLTTWASQWATDSQRISRDKAYRGL